MSINLVLDSSAMVLFARGSDAIGELLVLAKEDSRRVGVPTIALAQAFADARDADHGMLRLLVTNPHTVVLPLGAADAEDVGRFGRRLGLSTAHAVAAAIQNNAYLVTPVPKNVDGVFDPEMIIEV